ncbi:MAG: hypothetical protein M3Y07_00225 [Acidobacteriota bacterium]|nr:hypothetical protein [Acidobacteriota bacterium]
MPKQIDLFESFTTADEGNAIFCHQDFLQKVEENKSNQVGKRATLLLERLIVDERRQFYKSTQGINKGWRRSRLGGNHGSHYYAWWVPKGAPPLRDSDDFESAPAGSVFLRDIRHHDDHSELTPQSLSDNYLPVSVQDLRSQEYVPSPLTASQAKFASGRQKIRIVKGFPGSGKTTALWHAADASSSEATLYVTYSRDLAALAKSHFERFAPGHKRFRVATFARLVRDVLGRPDIEEKPERVSRERFLKELSGMSPRILGPWVDDRNSLYDEIYAHLIGSALPVEIGRFPACDRPRVPDRIYREQRRRFIGGGAADALLEVVNTLERRYPQDFHREFFPELRLAWDAVEALRQGKKNYAYDCIAVDEAQDLTPLESLAIIELAVSVQRQLKGSATLLVAGDEAQTVRPTDFEWGWFHDLAHHRLASPQEFKLGANLRSPRRIAQLINAVWDLYSNVAKQDRPSGVGTAEIEEDSSDQLVYCTAVKGLDLDNLLAAFTDRESLAVISLGERIPDYVPENLQHKILNVTEAKGLDFQSVCILDPGKQLQKIIQGADPMRRDRDVMPHGKRLAIDGLRVAISRPTERIYFLDVNPNDAVRRMTLAFINAADGSGDISPVIPDVVLKTLEEDVLPIEERVQLCESDARQYLDVKPEMAWSRAKQAISLLGRAGAQHSIVDEPVRRSAHLTLAQVSFHLAFRKVKLAAELGHPDLFMEAERNAALAGRIGLASTILAISNLQNVANPNDRYVILVGLVERMERHRDEMESWLSIEIAPHAAEWVQALERGLGDLAVAPRILRALPAAYKLFDVANGAARIPALRQKTVKALMEASQFEEALLALEPEVEKQPKLAAQCYEGLKQHGKAAEIYGNEGNWKDALRNYRAIPDFDKALEAMGHIEGSTGAETVTWIRDVQRVLETRPENYSRTATAAEKKYLANLLETNMGAPRTQKAVKKALARKSPGKRAPAQKR